MAAFLGYSRDTVAVALNYFDRYTCAKACPPTLAQAVAATALHVAAKFEEINPASLVSTQTGTLHDTIKHQEIFVEFGGGWGAGGGGQEGKQGIKSYTRVLYTSCRPVIVHRTREREKLGI